jgi:hypothetical protein
MDLQKARRFLLKIQALLENDSEQEMSRLERDLVRSYIMQLYEAVNEEKSANQEPLDVASDIAIKTKYEIPKPEKPPVQVIEPNVEVPKVTIPEIKPQKPQEIPVEIKYPQPEIISTPPRTEYIPIQPPVIEPIKEHVHKVSVIPEKQNVSSDQALAKLFELQGHDDVAERFSHVPIDDIQAAMGLNERIFTLKELFGGDKTLFDATCEQLNRLHSFTEAQSLLVHGPARIFKWGEPERLKMAEQFIRIVARRYPKSGH